MKFIKGMALALVAGALLAAPALRAEDKPAAADGQEQGWGGHRDGGERLKKALGLSDDQAAQWKKAVEGQREAGKLLRDKAKADEAQLAVLVDQKADDAKLTAQLKALESDGKALKEQMEKQREAFKAILTPLQQAKLVVMRSGKGGRGGMGGWQRKGGKACAMKDGKGDDGAKGQDADKGSDAAAAPEKE